ncbi:polycomb protein suz12-like [Lineus longissimus]|uniref:polycomb protein suz12-like n=1 Tax=Lineus longissimus TaxID=88925 RepID=UPI002B4E9297
MKPRIRDRDLPPPDKCQFVHVSADHELFLQAFEKPTQIYRYLRSRNVVSPVLLNRNLLYMRKRLSRPEKRKRSTFKIDSLLEEIAQKDDNSSQNAKQKSGFLNLEFHGLYQRDLPNNNTVEKVDVQPILLKLCHKKRKGTFGHLSQTELGKIEVPYNPDNVTKGTSPTVTVSSEQFSQTNGHSGKPLVLAIKAYFKRKKLQNGHCPAEGDDAVVEPKPKRSRFSKIPEVPENDACVYSAELTVFDKHKHCLLTDGAYELALQETHKPMTISDNETDWESLKDGQPLGPFEIFSSCPIVKFHLSWTSAPAAQDKSSLNDNLAVNDHCNNHLYDKQSKLFGLDIPSDLSKDGQQTPTKPTKLYYQFNYHNNTRQQTESRDDHICPWCLLNCMELYSLLKHLRLSHARFNFTYTPDPKGARIDVTLNDCYDGSYVGNPQDLHSHIGYAYSRNGPVRRTPVTYITVYRPKRNVPSLSEFLEHEEPETGRNRQIVQGHNRLYYHTVTNQPVRPEEIDRDSEEENDPEWLRQKTINLIEEFTDVNEGEKEVMKMWNLHIMRNNYIGDCQLPTACQTFVAKYGPTIVEKNLRKNFLLHLINLYNFSLIRSDTILRTLVLYDQLADSLMESKSEETQV